MTTILQQTGSNIEATLRGICGKPKGQSTTTLCIDLFKGLIDTVDANDIPIKTFSKEWVDFTFKGLITNALTYEAHDLDQFFGSMISIFLAELNIQWELAYDNEIPEPNGQSTAENFYNFMLYALINLACIPESLLDLVDYSRRILH